MERLAAWLWRRFRRQYAVVPPLAAEIANLSVFVPLSIGVIAALMGFTRDDALLMLGVAAPLTAIGPIVAFSTAGVHRRAILAWGRGDRRDPEAAWAAAVHAPLLWTERATVTNLVALECGALPTMAARSEMSWLEILVAVPALAVLICGFALVIGTGYAFLLRPMVDEVLAELPSSGIPPVRSRWSVTGRFYAAIGSSCFLSGVWAAAFASLADTRESRLVVTVCVAAVTAAVMLLLFGGLLVRPTLAPMADLIQATTRVRHGDFAEPVPVTSADGFGDLAIAFNEMLVGLRQREELHAAFGSYVDPVLAQRLVESGSDLFAGEDLELTVLFADVRDFTASAECIEPSDAVALLNRLFDVIVPVLHAHGGHANHYLGDGLLAVFGAPQSLSHHADAAVAAAVEAQQAVRAEFGAELRVGIGINSGRVIAGTVGGGGRHEFTVIGDTVNTAARVEQLTKETGDAILITEATRAALTSPKPRSATRGAFDLKGKSSAVTVHAVNPFPRSSR